MKNFFSLILILVLGVSMGNFLYSLYTGNWEIPLIIFVVVLIILIIYEMKNAAHAPEE
jgi:hypothetical protein